MRLLLDTHALLWWWTDDKRLSQGARAALMQRGNEVLVSAASAWEVATKRRLGKLPLPETFTSVNDLVARDGFIHLPVSTQHAERAGSYAQPHPDPFDRMLAAQAELENLTLVTCDPALTAFPISRLW